MGFDWEKITNDFGIEKAKRELVESDDGIHCSSCAEHISDHGMVKVPQLDQDETFHVVHPLSMMMIINAVQHKEKNERT